MKIEFGREICGDPIISVTREWLVTNGLGSYASGTIAGQLTRRYHGLLFAALQPPLGRTLMLAKLEETAEYDQQYYPLFSNCWMNDKIDPTGYNHIESFELENGIPLWRFAFANALLEKRIWMEQGKNTTYIHYTLRRASAPINLTIKALVNYRPYHYLTRDADWESSIIPLSKGICFIAFPTAEPLYLLSAIAQGTPTYNWYYAFYLPREKYRGLDYQENHLHIANFRTQLEPGDTVTIVASTESNPNLDGEEALASRRQYATKLLENSQANQIQGLKQKQYSLPASSPDWIKQLVLAADQFIVNRPIPEAPEGKTIIAGYPWFSDWGRDTMISLPGLTLCTGQPQIAKAILQTFARYVNQGMLPNRFPDEGETPEYNTVDATLWYFEALHSYYEATGDLALVEELWLILVDIIQWHQQGTRYNIHLDPDDGLIYAGQPGVQLTWMDAKIDHWVVTPRIGKPVEINALWYNALHTMANFARLLGKPVEDYEELITLATVGFARFWQEGLGYCYDVLDTPDGNDSSLRPNQILAVSLPRSPLTRSQQRSIVEICERSLLTSHGLRTLAPHSREYRGHYGGDRLQRDGAYHQGTVWTWLLGAFALAHFRVYHDQKQAQLILQPIAHHLHTAGIGTISEIFDGDAPMHPRGCIAQAWSVAEILRAWMMIENSTT